LLPSRKVSENKKVENEKGLGTFLKDLKDIFENLLVIEYCGVKYGLSES